MLPHSKDGKQPSFRPTSKPIPNNGFQPKIVSIHNKGWVQVTRVEDVAAMHPPVLPNNSGA
jgi:hypothetical protein